MNIVNRYFRCQIGRRADLSGLPYGLWFMWRPQDHPLKWVPVDFDLWDGMKPSVAHDLKLEQASFAERARREGKIATTDNGYWREDCGRFAQIKYSWKVGLAIYVREFPRRFPRCLFVDFERGGSFKSWQLLGTS